MKRPVTMLFWFAILVLVKKGTLVIKEEERIFFSIMKAFNFDTAIEQGCWVEFGWKAGKMVELWCSRPVIAMI